MQIEATYDNITAIDRNNTPPVNLWGDRGFEVLNGMFGYAETLRYHPSQRLVNVPRNDKPEFGIRHEYGGKALENIARAGTPKERIAQHHFDFADDFTRIDIALDIFDTGMNTASLIALVDNGQYVSKSKPRTAFKSYVNDGQTIYFGSKKARELRIYDKGKKSLVNREWLRVELSYCKVYAQSIAEHLAIDNFRLSDATGLIREFVDFPEHEIWKNVFSMNKIAMAKVSKHRAGKTRQWLKDQVSRAIAKALMDGDETILDDLNEWVEIQYNQIKLNVQHSIDNS